MNFEQTCQQLMTQYSDLSKENERLLTIIDTFEKKLIEMDHGSKENSVLRERISELEEFSSVSMVREQSKTIQSLRDELKFVKQKYIESKMSSNREEEESTAPAEEEEATAPSEEEEPTAPAEEEPVATALAEEASEDEDYFIEEEEEEAAITLQSGTYRYDAENLKLYSVDEPKKAVGSLKKVTIKKQNYLLDTSDKKFYDETTLQYSGYLRGKRAVLIN